MKKNMSILFTGLLVLLLSTSAWADLDPRAEFGTCGFTSTEETWEPDASGTLVKRVTYVSQCDVPGAGDETITITTEEDLGSGLVTTEVREAVRTVSAGIYTTVTNIFDGGGTLTGMEEHTYDYKTINTNIWFQDWTYYNWNGASFDLFGYTTKTVEWFAGEEMEVTYVYYDTTFRVDPVIPDDVPVLGSSAYASPSLPPAGKAVDSMALQNLGRMYERVRKVIDVNPNTQVEGLKILNTYGGVPQTHLCQPPSGVYVAGVLKGDRLNDTGDFFNGFWTRWVRFMNTVDGNLIALFGWTSDRDENEPTDDWWQARVRQDATGALQYIENAHRSGLTEEDHYDTYTLLNSMYMIESQTVKMFDYDEANPGDFTETTTMTNGMAAPVSYSEWTVVFD